MRENVIILAIDLKASKNLTEMRSLHYFEYLKISPGCWKNQNIVSVNEFWKDSNRVFKFGLISNVLASKIISKRNV